VSGYCAIARGHPVHQAYHDHEYGVAIRDERLLFERLCLEIFQAGLSWELVLKRRAGMNDALDQFDVDTIAVYDSARIDALMQDARLIRNRLKLEAIVQNAQRVRAMRADGGFAAWIDRHHPRGKVAWVKLFKATFRFTGGEIVGEFLLSLGYLPGAHAADCTAPAAQVATAWAAAERAGFSDWR
jgi:DNA-3-methyladenine glycosylase I